MNLKERKNLVKKKTYIGPISVLSHTNMNKIRGTVLIRFSFEDYPVKLALNRLKLTGLTAAEFVAMVIKKLESKLGSNPDATYGLFERFDGIEIMVPDTSYLHLNQSFMYGSSDFLIRPKRYFELKGKNYRS